MFNNSPDILTFNECRKLLKVGRNTLYDLIHNDDISAFKIGTRWKIPKESVIKYVMQK